MAVATRGLTPLFEAPVASSLRLPPPAPQLHSTLTNASAGVSVCAARVAVDARWCLDWTVRHSPGLGLLPRVVWKSPALLLHSGLCLLVAISAVLAS